MASMFGIGDGIWLGLALILIAIGLSIVFGKSKGLPSVIAYLLLGVFALCVLFWWPIRSADEPPTDEKTKTDIVLFARVTIILFLPVLTLIFINLYVRHNLFNVVRAESTAHRHGEPWIVEAKIRTC